MKLTSYFSKPQGTKQRQYEALRSFYVDKANSCQICKKFNFTASYFKKLCSLIKKQLAANCDPFFVSNKPGPRRRRTDQTLIDKIVLLRKQNYSITDIKANLHANNKVLSVDAIDKILKEDGFSPLPKRTYQERLKTQTPKSFRAPKSKELVIENETFTTEMNAGSLVFLPLLEDLGIINAIKNCGFPVTKGLSDVQYVLSFLAIKLLGNTRWAYDTTWNFDRALGLFAGLNVLPKSTALSTYSYRVSRRSNLKLLQALAKIFDPASDGEFNLDFKAIPLG